MKINAVIVDESVDRGQKAGRVMVRALREQMGATPWEFHVHVRKPDTVARDDAYAKYTNEG